MHTHILYSLKIVIKCRYDVHIHTYKHIYIHTYTSHTMQKPYLSNDIYGGDAAGRLHREHEMVRLSPQLDLLSERMLLRVPDTFPIYRKVVSF